MLFRLHTPSAGLLNNGCRELDSEFSVGSAFSLLVGDFGCGCVGTLIGKAAIMPVCWHPYRKGGYTASVYFVEK